MVRLLGLIRHGYDHLRPTSHRAGSRMRKRPVAKPWLVLLLTTALGIAASVGSWLGDDLSAGLHPSAVEVAGFYIALTVAALLNLEYYVRGEVDAIDQFEAAMVPAIFFLPIPIAVALVALAKATSQGVRGVHPLRALFNIAQWSAAATAGCVVFGALGGDGPHTAGDLGWLVVAMICVATVNALCLLSVIVLVQRPLGRRWLPRLASSLARDTSVGLLVNVAFGLLFTATCAWAPALAPLMLVPLALLHWASRGYAVGRVEQTRLRVMQQAMSALTAPTMPATGFTAFCGEIGRGFDRAGVDLILAGSPRPRVHSWRRDAAASQTADPEPMMAAFGNLDRPLHVDAVTADPSLAHLLAGIGWRDCTVAPVTVAGRSIGLLCLYEAEGVIAFAQRELQVIAALGQEAGLAVENANLVARMIAEQEKLSQIVNGAQDGIATLGAGGEVQAWNPAFERLSGFASTDILGSPGLDLLQPIDVARDAVSLVRWASAHDDPPTELLVRTATGDTRWLSCTYARAYGDEGHVNRLIITARDVSELKQAEALLTGQATVLQLIAEGSPLAQSLGELAANVAAFTEGGRCAILLLDPANSDALRPVASVHVGVATLRAIGAFHLAPIDSITGAAVLEQRMVTVKDSADDAVWPRLAADAFGAGIRSCQVVPIRASASEPVLGVIVVLRPTLPARREISYWTGLLERAARLAAIAVSRHEFESQLAHQASHDTLTGLPNRAVFLDRCGHAFRRHRRIGGGVVVFFIDLDRFKLVNDSRGHDVGDKLLMAVAERLSIVIRESDTVARFGGDEFAILCEGISDPMRILELAHRVQLSLAAPVSLAGGDVFVRASIGVAMLTDDIDVETLIGNADAAMYRAKRLGGNRCEFYEQMMRSPTSLLLKVQSELHLALEREEFFMQYQPLVSLVNGDVTGAEALVRWRHPQRGVLAPKDFLSLAESSGLIVPIGKQIIGLACRQARSWQTTRPGLGVLQVNINLSPLEFLQPELVQTIAEVLDATGVMPSMIGLEITETAIMEDIDATASAMQELKELGVAMIIDDFGTGYSSLTHLKRFPVDELKVDRSFVAGLGTSGKDGAIVNAVIALAHSLDLTAIAEGVETADQRERLQSLGCDVGQGYYFGRPGPADDLLSSVHSQPSPI